MSRICTNYVTLLFYVQMKDVDGKKMPDPSNSKVSLVYGQMNEPPGARARVALTGLTVAEYFRDLEGRVIPDKSDVFVSIE